MEERGDSNSETKNQSETIRGKPEGKREEGKKWEAVREKIGRLRRNCGMSL